MNLLAPRVQYLEMTAGPGFTLLYQPLGGGLPLRLTFLQHSRASVFFLVVDPAARSPNPSRTRERMGKVEARKLMD